MRKAAATGGGVETLGELLVRSTIQLASAEKVREEGLFGGGQNSYKIASIFLQKMLDREQFPSERVA